MVPATVCGAAIATSDPELATSSAKTEPVPSSDAPSSVRLARPKSDEHVARLEVAVHESRGVGGRQPLARSHEHVEQLPPATRAVGQPGPQIDALDQLHRNKDVVVECACVVDRHDVRVRQLGHCPGFAEQAALREATGLAEAVPDADELDRHIAIELAIVGTIHHARAPASETTAKCVTLGDARLVGAEHPPTQRHHHALDLGVVPELAGADDLVEHVLRPICPHDRSPS